jgi:hypothetical protein
MEAVSEPQHRTNSKPLKAGRTGQAGLAQQRPISDRVLPSIGAGSGGTLLNLTPGELPGSAPSGAVRGTEATMCCGSPGSSRMTS